MTLKSRWIGLVTILVLFAMAPSSFAQVQIQIFPDVSSQEVQTNRNAQTARPGTNGAGLLVSGSLLGASGFLSFGSMSPPERKVSPQGSDAKRRPMSRSRRARASVRLPAGTAMPTVRKHETLASGRALPFYLDGLPIAAGGRHSDRRRSSRRR